MAKQTKIVYKDGTPYKVTLEVTKINNKQFNEKINGKDYRFLNNDNVEITKDIKSKIISKAKAILSKEDNIKTQVYKLYKDTTQDQFDKDYIEGFEILAPDKEFDLNQDDEFALGIIFSSVNQFYTMIDKNGKIIPKHTFVN